MTEKKGYPPGDFCWTELSTSDWKAAKKFYASLFGWTTDELPMGPDQPPYVTLQKNGKKVCAMYENKKIKPNWLSYVSVKSADETAKKVKSAGGKLENEPFDVFEFGRMAAAQDLQGARFGIWQPKKHIGADVINEPGTMCWNELWTTDVEAAQKFYTAVFSWRMKMSPGYTEAYVGDVAVGGIIKADPKVGNAPPHWSPYFAVDDADASAKKAKSMGAMLAFEPRDIPNVGRFAVLADPQGARFNIVKLQRS